MSNLCAYFYSGCTDSNLLGISSTGKYDNRSNQQLFQQVLGFEKLLAECGIEQGDRVLVFAQSSLHALTVILACFHRGAVAVPLPPLTTTGQLQSALDLHTAALIYCDEDVQNKVPELLECGLPVLNLSSLTEIVVSAKVSLIFNEKPDNLPALRVQSSGSTGSPKIIEYTHGKLQSFFYHHNIIYEEYFYGRGSDAPLISVFPFSHLAGLAMPLQSIFMGQATCILEGFEASRLLNLMASTRAHFIALVPSMYASLLEESKILDELNFSQLEYCVCLGEAAGSHLLNAIEQKFQAQVLCAYGLSECLPGLAHKLNTPVNEPVPQGSCGRHIFGELMLINKDSEPQKKFGQLCIRNDTVFDCYEQQALNEAALHEGWFVTQDLFYRDSEGFYYHRGRADSLFTYHGKTIAPAEIENLALAHDDVKRACCVPLVDQQQATVPGLIVEIESGRTCTVTTLMNFLLQQGKSHLLPKQILITSAIPLIGPGKLDRMACKASLQHALEEAAA